MQFIRHLEYASFGAAYREQWRRLSEEENFKLIQVEAGVTAYDLEFATRRLIDLGVDAILLFQHDPYAAGQAVQLAQEAGIPVAIHGIRPASGIKAPYVGFSEYETCRLLGQIAAERFTEQTPGVIPRVLVLNNRTVERDVNRERGFLDGFRSRVPDVEIIQAPEDSGTLESALRVAEVAFFNNPEINMVYATSDERAFGVMQALNNANIAPAEVGIVAVGGGERAMKNVLQQHNWWAQVGLNVRGVAEKSYEVLSMMMAGDIPFGSEREILVDSPIFVDPSVAEVRAYLQNNHGIEAPDLTK